MDVSSRNKYLCIIFFLDKLQIIFIIIFVILILIPIIQGYLSLCEGIVCTHVFFREHVLFCYHVERVTTSVGCMLIFAITSRYFRHMLILYCNTPFRALKICTLYVVSFVIMNYKLHLFNLTILTILVQYIPCYNNALKRSMSSTGTNVFIFTLLYVLYNYCILKLLLLCTLFKQLIGRYYK